jgi:tripartite-type tricarboxylate transporter receptor subunit TctC
LHGFLAVFLSFLPAAAQPQGYPLRPIRMIVPFNPGGSSPLA